MAVILDSIRGRNALLGKQMNVLNADLPEQELQAFGFHHMQVLVELARLLNFP